MRSRRRHEELDWHRQSEHSRYRRDYYETTRKRLNQKRKPRFDRQDGMFCVLIVVAVLVSLDALFGGLYR